MDSSTIITLLGISLPLVVTILGWIIARKTEEIKIMRTQLSDKKIEAYSTALDMFYTLLKNQKLNKKTDINWMLDKMLATKKGIFLYGSDEVFRSFNQWLLHCSEPASQLRLNDLLGFVIAMRKDIYGGRTKLTERDFLLNLTQSEADADNLKG